MKKALALALAAIMLLLFFGCDTGTSPGGTEVTLDTGSLTISLADPGVAASYDDGISPYAVVTGATASGSTFHRQISLDNAKESLTVSNLIPGTYNVKVKVWDNLSSEDDDDDGDGTVNFYDSDDSDGTGEPVILEDVIALGYETVSVSADAVATLNVDLYTEDDLKDILSATDGVFDTFDIPEKGWTAFTWGVFSLFAYDEETALEILEEADDSTISEIETYLAFISDSAAAGAFIGETLSEYDDVYGMTYLDMLNDVLGDIQDADYYVNLFSSMIESVYSAVVGDYQFLFYDFVDLTISGLTHGETLAGSDAIALSVSSEYDFSVGTFSWVLNGSGVGTGDSYSLSPEACAAGLNILSVQYEYAGVILGAETIVFYRDSEVQRLTVADIPFVDSRLKSVVLATGLTYADEVTSIALVNYANLDFNGIEYLVNLDALYITNGGTFTESQLAPLYSLSNLTVLLFRYNQPSAELLAILQANLPNVTIYLQ